MEKGTTTTVANANCGNGKPASSASCTTGAVCTSYEWKANPTYGTCSNSCGGGTQSRTGQACQSVSGTKKTDVGDANCAGLPNEPAATKACNSAACATKWVSGGWSGCSKACGTGSRTRSVTCKETKNGLDKTVANSKCGGGKPTTSEDCNTQACAAFDWVLGTYGACSKTCGLGTKSRAVSCKNSGTGAAAAASQCTNAKPSTSSSCNLQGCPKDPAAPSSYGWVEGAYGPCDITCGETGTGIRTRAVTCEKKGVKFDDFMCTLSKPKVNAACVGLSICPEYAFVPSEWSQCSETCGRGTRTRTAPCKNVAARPYAGAADSKCTGVGIKKPPTSRMCEVEVCSNKGDAGKGTWYASEWSSCSRPCGYGEQTRSVSCRDASNIVTGNENECGGARPSQVADCNAHACPRYVSGPWGACSKVCDDGTRARTLDCIDHTGSKVAALNCGALPAPVTSSACNDQPCAHWHRSPWGRCDKFCGTGKQTRSLVCRKPHDAIYKGVAVRAAKIAELCTTVEAEKPPTEQPCNGDPCGANTWTLSPWSTCSKACGSGGTQFTTLTCSGASCDAPELPTDDTWDAASKKWTRDCNTFACPTYEWGYGDDAVATAESSWGVCDATCGAGEKTRLVECRNVTPEPVAGYAVPFAVVADSMCTGAKPSMKESCAAGACAGTGSVCKNKKCECKTGFGGVKCDLLPDLYNVRVMFDAAVASLGVPLGDVVPIRWLAKGAVPEVDVLLYKPGATYPIYLSGVTRHPQPGSPMDDKGPGASGGYEQVFLWKLPPALSEDAIALGFGDGYKVEVRQTDSIKATSAVFKIAGTCSYSNCGEHGTCSDATGKCTCKDGHTGTNCKISPIDAAQCNTAQTSSTPLTGTTATCECKDKWSGPKCLTPTTCAVPLACLNGGFQGSTGEINGVAQCGATCACPASAAWQGTSCETCGLTCVNGGKANDKCTSCACAPNSGYFGDKCACQYFTFTVRIKVPEGGCGKLIADEEKIGRYWAGIEGDFLKSLESALGFKGTFKKTEEKEINDKLIQVSFQLRESCSTTAIGCGVDAVSGRFMETMALVGTAAR